MSLLATARLEAHGVLQAYGPQTPFGPAAFDLLRFISLWDALAPATSIQGVFGLSAPLSTSDARAQYAQP